MRLGGRQLDPRLVQDCLLVLPQGSEGCHEGVQVQPGYVTKLTLELQRCVVIVVVDTPHVVEGQMEVVRLHGKSVLHDARSPVPPASPPVTPVRLDLLKFVLYGFQLLRSFLRRLEGPGIRQQRTDLQLAARRHLESIGQRLLTPGRRPATQVIPATTEPDPRVDICPPCLLDDSCIRPDRNCREATAVPPGAHLHARVVVDVPVEVELDGLHL